MPCINIIPPVALSLYIRVPEQQSVSTGYYQGTRKFNKGAYSCMTIKIGLFCQGVTNVSTGKKNKIILDHNTTSETVFVIFLTAGTIFLKFLLVE